MNSTFGGAIDDVLRGAPGAATPFSVAPLPPRHREGWWLCIGQPQVRSLAHLCPSPPEPLPRRAAGRGFPPPARDRRPRRPLPRLPPPRRSGRIDLVTHAAAACDLCGQAESAELFEIRICADCRDAP